ncbi:MAG: sialidase-1, partial [Planctomycetota bacterium]
MNRWSAPVNGHPLQQQRARAAAAGSDYHVGMMTLNALVRGMVCALLLVCAPAETLAQETQLSQTDVFVSGEGGYNTYRIPAAVVTNNGTVLAFCEGRRNGRSDTGDIDILLRRSDDNGKTWSDTQVVWDDKGNTCGNPCPVVDRETGTIWLLLTWNSGTRAEGKTQAGFGTDSRRVFVTHSEDDGATWAEPVN